MQMTPVELGRLRTEDDGCRRYRPVAISFDTRANLLSVVIDESWEPKAKELWARNQRLVREGLLHEFGVDDGDRKIEDFIAVGPAPWSVIASHNMILNQVRRAFVLGSYYPALVGAAGLGERILNERPAHTRSCSRRSWATRQSTSRSTPTATCSRTRSPMSARRSTALSRRHARGTSP